MPALPPVTTATLPSSLPMGSSSDDVRHMIIII
jgi:hypothetical protein